MNDIIRGSEHVKLSLLLLASMSALFVTCFIGYFVWMAYYDDAPPFTSTYVRVTDMNGVERTQFKAGEVMLVHRDLCFTKTLPVTIGRSLMRVDTGEPVNVTIDMTSGIVKKGCVPNAKAVEIPDYTPAGMYRFVSVIQYSNNAFRNDAMEFPAPVIEIVR